MEREIRQIMMQFKGSNRTITELSENPRKEKLDLSVGIGKDIIEKKVFIWALHVE